jgi:hypothetical protein
MRHWTLDLTMLARRGENVYAAPSLLDVAGALEALPELSLEGAAKSRLTTHGRAAEGLARRAQEASMKGPVSS